MPVRIGMTKVTGAEDKNEPYVAWLLAAAPDAEIVRLSIDEHGPDDIARLDGLLLTGGGDVHPDFYGCGDAMDRVKGVDTGRDEFEFMALRRALDADLPILGICRGAQVMNVHFGGTLVVDCVDAGYNDHARDANGAQRTHTVRIAPGSLLHAITGAEAADVSSSHHQAASAPGHGLTVTAVAPDGVAEAVEWSDRSRGPFLLGVQWHPERMQYGEPASGRIAERFVREMQESGERRK